ncbi:chloride channel protein [Aneurinibacillus tyrosinisolvens]|uniref:chloride channel protein n=1 Tax=Aneurinibacillus tyrosinisolvens TaxID=1443435 RepID=UPI0006999291|nr:chloride channel protein [Aneurinibacillus tyrosinisolvens]
MNQKRHMYSEPFIMFAALFRWFILASLTGIIVGTTTSLFLNLLQYASDKTSHLPFLIQFILLPLGGLITGLLIRYGAPDAAGHGTEAVIMAVHEQNGKINAKVAPIKALATIVTLACGGSAGKEGPCAQIGGAMASSFADIIRLNEQDRKKLVICGISAGFASVFGTPLAGAIFGIEVLAIGGLMYEMILPCFISGITSYEISQSLGISYTYFPFTHNTPFSEILFIKMIGIGLLCGVISWIFIEIFEWFQKTFRLLENYLKWKPALPMIGGFLLSFMILFIPTDYLGLSIPLLDTALEGHSVSYLAFFWKILFVAITLASGFSGGIVTPLFVIGATAGNALGHLFHINPALGAAVGMVAVVASGSNTPISAFVMGVELFGGDVGIFLFTTSVVAYMIIGHRSVYPSQMVSSGKSSWIHIEKNISLEQETNIHISYALLRKLKRKKLKKEEPVMPPQKTS